MGFEVETMLLNYMERANNTRVNLKKTKAFSNQYAIEGASSVLINCDTSFGTR